MGALKTALAALCIFTSLSFALTFDQVGTRKRALKTYGGAQVAAVGKCEQVFSFRCDIKGWPEIIGKDIPVRIVGIEMPDIVARHGAPNKFFQQQSMKFLATFLKNAKKIELANIRRGTDFCLVADVIADGQSLAEILIKKGFAKKAEEITVSNKPNIKKIIESKTPVPENVTWVASSNSKVFHTSNCSFASRLKKDSTINFPTRKKATETGRRPCKNCKP